MSPDWLKWRRQLVNSVYRKQFPGQEMAQFELNLEALIYLLVGHVSHHLFLS